MTRVHLAAGYEDLGHLASHISSLMHRVLHSGFSPAERSYDWTPAVDVSESADRYEVVVELAGVRREDIEVFTENHILTIAGRRGDPTCADKVCVHQIEIEQGRFRRRLRLPEDADEGAISARQREGLLVITVPKRGAAREESRP